MSGDGTVTNVPNHVPKGTKPPDPVKTQGIQIASESVDNTIKGNTVTEAKAVPEAPKDPDDLADFSEDERKAFGERVAKKLNKKHAQLIEAREELEAADRLAEGQYNERVLAEKRATTAEARLAELEKTKVPPVEAEKEPDETEAKYKDASGQFDWKKYSKDLARYEANQALAEKDRKDNESKAAAAQAEVMKRVQASAEKARAAHDDFDSVMRAVAQDSSRDQVPQYVLNYLSESAEAGEVAYYLAKNPEESQRIAKLSPIRGIAELAKLEERLTKPSEAVIAPPKVSVPPSPPPPIEPLSGAGSSVVNSDPAKMSYKELRAYERARRRSS